MLQLYGNPRSRAMRCLWMLEEMGQPYQLIEKSTRADDLQSAEYLRLNPNARIPTLVDGDLVLWESMAINLYLAQKYEGPMHCAGPEVLGLAAQWSFWAMLEMEALLLDLLQHRAMLPEFARDASYAERDELLLKKPLAVLNDALAGRDYLVGNSFTVLRSQRGGHSRVGQDGPTESVGPRGSDTVAWRLPGTTRLRQSA
jgi:glutathione S-transferase